MNNAPSPPAPMSGNRVRPVGVSIISVLYFIGAGLMLLLGFLGTTLLTSLIGGSVANIGTAVMWVVVLVAAVVQILVGWGLWKGKNWARIVAIVFAVLAILGALPNLLKSGIITVVIQGVYLWYLGFNASAKEYFK